jgi:TonB family protein
MTAMELLVESAFKTSIVIAIALAATALSRRQSAAVRHWILACGVLCAASTPVLGVLVPSWHLPIDILSASGWIPSSLEGPHDAAAALSDARVNKSTDRAAPRPEGSPLRARARAAWLAAPSRAVAAIWIGGAAIALLFLCAGVGRLAWVAWHAPRLAAGRWTESAAEIARHYGLQSRVQLLQSEHATLLVTCGLLRPAIILPRCARHWSEDRIRVVLAHELAHIKRHDWAIQILAEIVRAIYWFNPLVWLISRRLRQESEHATDDAVLSSGMSGSDYAGHLLDLARALTGRYRGTWLPAPAIARPSSFERRVRAMLNESVNRAPATRSARVVTLAAISCLTVALAAAQGSFSTFSGTVLDETNGVMPDVTLILTNPERNAKYEVKSDGTGHFEFVGLPPGDYQLETKIAGFATLRGTLTLTGQNAQRDLVLQIGSLEETITISGPGTAPWPGRAGGRLARRPDPTCGKEPANATGEKIGGNIRAPRKLVDVKPYYPPSLYDAHVGGTVVLQARIDEEGRVSSVDVVSSAHPDLSTAAIEAVRQWEFDSTILNCRKVEVAMKVTANFVAR